MFPVHQVWPKPLQGTVKGGRRQGRQRKSWEDNIREWTGLEFGKSQKAMENREKWRKLVAKSSVVPQRPSWLWDWWWWWWCVTLTYNCNYTNIFSCHIWLLFFILQHFHVGVHECMFTCVLFFTCFIKHGLVLSLNSIFLSCLYNRRTSWSGEDLCFSASFWHCSTPIQRYPNRFQYKSEPDTPIRMLHGSSASNYKATRRKRDLLCMYMKHIIWPQKETTITKKQFS